MTFGMAESEAIMPMREVIMTELSQAIHDLVSRAANLLPRLVVMLALVLIGWLVAYVVKWVLRSILHLVKFDKVSESAGASQFLNQSALPTPTELVSRFVFWVAWLGFMFLGRQCSASRSHSDLAEESWPGSSLRGGSLMKGAPKKKRSLRHCSGSSRELEMITFRRIRTTFVCCLLSGVLSLF